MLTPGNPGQAVVVFHHLGFDQFALAFDLQRHPCRRPQRTNVAHFGGVVIISLIARQRYFVRAE